MKTLALFISIAVLFVPNANAETLGPEYTGTNVPSDCKLTRKAYTTKGVDFVAHRILHSGSDWQVSLLTEKRNLPSDRQKLTSLKAFYNQTIINLKKQGFTKLDVDLPDLSAFDAKTDTVIPLRMELGGQPYLGEVRVMFTNMAHVFVLIAKDNKTFESAKRFCAGISPTRDDALFANARRKAREANTHASSQGNFSIRLPSSFDIIDESTVERDAHQWLTAKSPQLTIRVATLTDVASAMEAYKTALEAQKKLGEVGSLGLHELRAPEDVLFRIDDVFDGQFTSFYCQDSGDQTFAILVEFKDLLSYCENVPLTDAIVDTLQTP